MSHLQVNENIINNINSLPNSSLSRVDSYLKQAVQKPQTNPPCNCTVCHAKDSGKNL